MSGLFLGHKMSLNRHLHDGYSSLRRRFARESSVIASDEVLCSYPSWVIQDCGAETFQSDIEKLFYRSISVAIRHEWPRSTLYRLSKPFVSGDQGHTYIKNGSVLPFESKSTVSTENAKLRYPIKSLARKLNGVYFHLTGLNHENHGHFIAEHLPRLVASIQFIKSTKCTILVAPQHSKWQVRYLSLLGFPKDRIVEGSHGTVVVEELYYAPSLSGSLPISSPQYLRQISSQFAAATDSIRPLRLGQPYMLWLSRDDAPNKKLLNEPELIEICSRKFGRVIKLCLTGKSLTEQIELFKGAWCIIGATGQAFINSLFVSDKIFVIIDCDPALQSSIWANAYASIAACGGNQYLRLTCNDKRDRHKNFNYPNDKFNVDMDLLYNIIHHGS